MSAHRVLHDMLMAPHVITDPGNGGTITVDRDLSVVHVVTAAAETRTLAQPNKSGLTCTIVLYTDGGDCTLTVTGGFNQLAETTATLNDAGDAITFRSICVGGTYYWRVVESIGVPQGDVNRMAVQSVTAVGSVQSLATNSLIAGLNVVTGGGTNLGVKLPTPVVGARVIVANESGSTCIVYGDVTATIINALATTTGYSVATTKTTELICENSTRWWTIPLAVA